MTTVQAHGSRSKGLNRRDKVVKRSFDIVAAAAGLVFTWWLLVLAYAAASIDTGESGFFTQTRVGKDGRLFRVIKIRTMRTNPSYTTTVTRTDDPRITRLGGLFRRTRVDELPQLLNVLVGQMSFVGPRPDVPGFADELVGGDRIILSIRPGLTGPATLRYRQEEEILASQADPETYNREVIFPEKVKLNREYVENYRFWQDIEYIYQTILRR